MNPAGLLEAFKLVQEASQEQVMQAAEAALVEADKPQPPPPARQPNRKERRAFMARVRSAVRPQVRRDYRKVIEADRLNKPDPPKNGRKWGEPYAVDDYQLRVEEVMRAGR